MPTLTAYRLLIASMFLVAFIHRLTAHAARGTVSQKAEGWIMLPLRLLGLAGWAGLLAYAINPRWLGWASFPLPAGIRWAGAALAVGGIALAVWGALHIRGNVTRTVATRSDHQLITTGPYRYIRHPLYTAGLMSFVGLGLLAANAFILMTLALAFAFVIIRLPREEAGLLAAFGEEYRTYRQRTGAFLPRVVR